jgi:hypothetical protein
MSPYDVRMTDPRPITDWRPLAIMLTGLAAAYAIAYRLMPYDQSAWMLWPFGAWAMYAGARLPVRIALPLVVGGFMLSDLLLQLRSPIPPNYLFYLCLGVSLLIGRGLLFHSQAIWRVIVGGIGSYVFFFLATNIAAWAETALPEYSPHTLTTLLLALENGLAFLRYRPGHLIGLGDVLPALALFGAHAYLARAYFPAEQVAVEAVR